MQMWALKSTVLLLWAPIRYHLLIYIYIYTYIYSGSRVFLRLTSITLLVSI